MNKKEVYNYLKEKEIWFEAFEHKAVFNMSEASEIEVPYPESEAKNLFVCDDKKMNFYLIIVKGDKRVNLKDFRKKIHSRPLSFASEKYLMDILGLIPGAVTPLGILNDEERKTMVYIDDEFFQNNEIIGVHPNDNTASVWLKVNDLINIIKEHNNFIEIVEL